MAVRIVAAYGLYQALKDEGYVLPDECCDVSLDLPVDGRIQLVLRVNTTDKTLAQIGRALVRMSEAR